MAQYEQAELAPAQHSYYESRSTSQLLTLHSRAQRQCSGTYIDPGKGALPQKGQIVLRLTKYSGSLAASGEQRRHLAAAEVLRHQDDSRLEWAEYYASPESN